MNSVTSKIITSHDLVLIFQTWSCMSCHKLLQTSPSSSAPSLSDQNQSCTYLVVICPVSCCLPTFQSIFNPCNQLQQTTRNIIGVTNGLCEHSRACRALQFFLRARAEIKICFASLRATQKFGEHEQASTRLNFNGPFITPHYQCQNIVLNNRNGPLF